MTLAPAYRVWWINLAIGWPLSVGIAALSWHFVEKPSLRLRKWLAPKAALSRPVLEEQDTSVAPSVKTPPVMNLRPQ